MIETDDETESLERLRRGDRDACEAMVRRHYLSVWRQHYLLCGEGEEAADLTQETFIEVWRSLGSFAGRSSVRTWVHTIAVRVWSRKSRKFAATNGPAIPESLPSVAPSPEAEALRALQHDAIACALRRLPEEQRVVVVLHYRQEMTHPEIAAALNIPLGTVKSRMHEGMRRLRRVLGGTVEEEVK
jgi:RNA polymerase sigma-70 factor (ECF subfamily)